LKIKTVVAKALDEYLRQRESFIQLLTLKGKKGRDMRGWAWSWRQSSDTCWSRCLKPRRMTEV